MNYVPRTIHQIHVLWPQGGSPITITFSPGTLSFIIKNCIFHIIPDTFELGGVLSSEVISDFGFKSACYSCCLISFMCFCLVQEKVNMPVIEEYELHGGKHDRPAKFISIICKCVQTKTERHFAKKDQELLIKTFEDLLGIDPIKDTCIIEDPEGDEIIDYVQNGMIQLVS